MDREIVSGASARDVEEVYRLHYRRFLRVTTAITGNEDAGHDAVQDGFAAALRSRRSYRGAGPLEGWLWRTVVNEALKTRTRVRPTAELLGDAAAPNGSVADELGVRTWIAGLPERQRLAVFLRYYADLDYRSIAEALKIETGTVAATLSSAHAALRKRLGEVRR
jgi:RNA polymerase sigma factor (sigma-70 family)